jgi:hypothetical protein
LTVILTARKDNRKLLTIDKEARKIFQLYGGKKQSRGSSGGLVSDYGLDDRGSIPDKDRGFFF